MPSLREGAELSAGNSGMGRDPVREAADREQRVMDEILRESLRSRCRQARPALAGMLVVTGLTVPLLGRGLEPRSLAIWLGILLVLLLARYANALQAERALQSPREALQKYDKRFRVLSVLSQAVVGTGIWLVPASASETAPYVMTMLLAIYGVGTMVNLAHDFRSLRLSMPLLLVQPVAFWTMQGFEGVVIAVILLGITWIMISSSQNSMLAFVDSIRIRFEKDALLEQLGLEKQVTSEALEAAEEANRAKSFFMAAASHDLRQPLYAATLLSDTLSLHPLTPEAAELVARQRGALGAATGLFDNLLDLSKFESGAIETRFQTVSLERLFAQMEAEFMPIAQAKGLSLVVERGAPLVTSDSDLLTRMLRNLVSNAIRYTEQGMIRLRAEERACEVTVIVEDTGIGIPQKDQERVFKEFQQLDNPQRTRDKGVGLGLAIVKQISILLSHPIGLESEPGRGTRFTILVPAGKGAGAEQAIGSGGVGGIKACRASGLTVWIVEDDPLVSAALAGFLSSQGCSHYVATNRAEIETLERQSGLPDCVILDDMLGKGESGLDLALWLAGRIPGERIMLTTGNTAAERWDVLKASGLRVLRKPVSTDAISDFLGSMADAAGRNDPAPQLVPI